VKKSIWPKSKLMQNVCRRPSDRLPGILARLFLEPKFPHINFSIFDGVFAGREGVKKLTTASQKMRYGGGAGADRLQT
jgi:hypothetical protein